MANGYAGSFRLDKLVLWEEDAQLATKEGGSAGSSPPGSGSLFKIGGYEREEDGPETRLTAKDDPSTL